MAVDRLDPIDEAACEALLARSDMTGAQKLDKLREWESDARQVLRASNEAMQGGRAYDLSAIERSIVLAEAEAERDDRPSLPEGARRA